MLIAVLWASSPVPEAPPVAVALAAAEERIEAAPLEAAEGPAEARAS